MPRKRAVPVVDVNIIYYPEGSLSTDRGQEKYLAVDLSESNILDEKCWAELRSSIVRQLRQK